MQTLENLLQKVKKYNPEVDETLISLAFDFADKAHKGQKRMSGDDYITHPLATAHLLTDLKLSDTIIIAGLLHDVPEETEYTVQDIRENFGDDIAQLVEGITKLGKIKYRGIQRYRENLRKMFMAMSEDIRVILIKCADRIHNLETLEHLPKHKQHRIAQESIEILAQIAHRLGITKLQDQLETKAFKFVNQDEYKWVTSLITESYKEKKQRQLANIMNRLPILLKQNNVNYTHMYGRTKQIYSLYKKLLRKEKDITKIYDFLAARIIVPTISDCYHVLGVIHQTWQPLAGRIKDYIAQPKPNGYKSLHTTVFDKGGNIIEVQIRTQEMHDQAEYGIAAHWLYKSTGNNIDSTDIKWLKDLSDWKKKYINDETYLEHLKLDIFQSRIFVFTPKGDVIELPEEATPVDFAYHIHTMVGHSCERARINTKICSLDTKLRNGDMIEIIPNKHRTRPKAEWIAFVKTRTARNHIRNRMREFKYKK